MLPTAINESGVVTGSYTDSAGDTYGFVDENGEIETVAVPGASSTIVNGVNAQGVIYGSDSAGQQAFYGRLGPALASRRPTMSALRPWTWRGPSTRMTLD